MGMGTRGAFGFYHNGEDKIAYNQHDSYPDGLGEDVVTFIQETGIEKLQQIASRIQLVDSKQKPTPEQIEHCKPWTDLGVSTGSTDDWYCLLRLAQGNLHAYNEGLSYMKDAKSFMQDSLFNEWSYIINLDAALFEVYEGYNYTYQENRYASKTPNEQGYHSVHLIKTYPLSSIPSDWVAEVESLAEQRHNSQI